MLSRLLFVVAQARHLRAVRDVPRAVLHIKRATATSRDWIAVAESLTAILLVKDTTRTILRHHLENRPPAAAATGPKGGGPSVAILEAVVSEGREALKEVQQMLGIVDWAESEHITPPHTPRLHRPAKSAARPLLAASPPLPARTRRLAKAHRRSSRALRGG